MVVCDSVIYHVFNDRILRELMNHTLRLTFGFVNLCQLDSTG
jgi:hypothetical protein